MKKIILLLLLHVGFTNAFSQDRIYQQGFDEGVVYESWKITKGKWYIARLEEKGIKPPEGENNYALASAGDAEILIDIPVESLDPEIPLILSFTYWVHSKGSRGLAGLTFFNPRGDSLTSINFRALPENRQWDKFQQEFRVPKGTAVIRMKLGERAGGVPNTVYFKSIWIARRR
ncbi:MAG: hypothetical protein WCF67_25250 [Chitinophagaceae bacterium]